MIPQSPAVSEDEFLGRFVVSDITLVVKCLNLLIFGVGCWLVYWLLTSTLESGLTLGATGGALFLVVLLVLYLWVILRRSAAANGWLLLTLIVCFVVLEVRSTGNLSPYAADAFRSPVPYMYFTARPGAEIPAIPSMSQYKDPIRIDARGVRVERSYATKHAGEVRIIVLGGSTVFNGTPLSHTIPGRLEQNLGGNHRVYNFGVVSYVSGQEVNMLIHRVLELQPDVVITYDGANDIVSPYVYDPRPDYPYNFMVYEKGVQILQEKGLDELMVLVVKKSNFLSGFGQFRPILNERLIPQQRLRREAGYGSEAWEMQIIDGYLRNLKTMCALAKGSGFRYAAFLQPMLHFKEPKLGNEARLLGDDNFQSYVKRQYGRVRGKFANLASSNDSSCQYQDLSHSLRDVNEQIFWDYVHTDNRGNEILALKIAGKLRPWLLGSLR